MKTSQLKAIIVAVLMLGAANVGLGQPRDQYGRPVDQYGRLLSTDRYGNYVDRYGHRVDQYGRAIDSYGRLIDQYGRVIDDTPNYSTDRYGVRTDQYGRRVDQYGRVIDTTPTYSTDRYGYRIDQYGRRVDRYGRVIDTNTRSDYRYGQYRQYGGRDRWSRSMTVPAGTVLSVRLDTEISTDNMRAGDRWSGTLNQAVTSGGRIVIPSGSSVEGVVTQSIQGDHNNPPQVALAVRSLSTEGDYRAVNATSDAIVAGSKNAQKIGAIAIGAAAGALLGHAISDRHGTLIGGLLGGAAGYGATRHAYRTLVLKQGTVMTFTTTEDMVASR